MAEPRTPTTQSVINTDDVVVEVFPVGPLQCNCTLVGHKTSGQAVVVDPGGDVNHIIQRLEHHHLSLKHILHTHAHFDHFLGAGQLREQTEAPLALHAEDRFLWDNLKTQCDLFGIPYTPAPPPDATLSHEESITLGHTGEASLACGCKHTPGHTPGSMCFYWEPLNLLVGGDTLFRRSVGRTDLWGGDFDTLSHSIKTELYTLDEATTVITGHGPATTIGEELRDNPIVNYSS